MIDETGKRMLPDDGPWRSSGRSGAGLTDDEAQTLFAEVQPRLLRYLTLRLRSPEDAEEVLQEAFIRFLKVRETAEVENDHALLVSICARQAIDRIRHNASRVKREKSWSEQHYRAASEGGVLGSQMAVQERGLSAREDIKEVIAVLDGFSETVRNAFILHRFKGLTHKEVAARLGLSQSTVEKHIMKVSRQLMLRLGPRK
jgi:RNA polymerase sigma-70 factor (ECF subfamily)